MFQREAMNDPIVDEVRRVRGEHAARFNYDLWAIFRDIQEQQKRSGLKFVSFADEAEPNQSASAGRGRNFGFSRFDLVGIGSGG